MIENKYKVDLEVFQGPMDLLLHLIDKTEINIYDIPINNITEEFLNYLKSMEELNLEITSEFLLMASSLLEIKSKMLLPADKKNIEDGVEEDPRLELVQRIVEYKKYKEISVYLKELQEREDKIYYKPREDLFYEEQIKMDFTNMDLKVLVKSLDNIIKRTKDKSINMDLQIISRDKYSLDFCMEDLKNLIGKDDIILFSEIIGLSPSVEKIIMYFLAMLELGKVGLLYIEQKEDFSDLTIYARDDING